MIFDIKFLVIGLSLVVLSFLSPLIKDQAKDRAQDLSKVQADGQVGPSYQSGHSLRSFTLGYDRLLADYYWLAFVSYVGDGRARALDKYCRADSYLDRVTRLDPHFIEAYWFSAFTVGADQGKPELAARIIDRGIEANPFDWSLPFIAGFNQYLFAGNDQVAARYYRMAARFPHAPVWLNDQATVLERGIPRIYKQIELWENIYRSQESPLVKEKARETLASLWLSLYKNAHTAEVKGRAAAALRALGRAN